jgi:hypothetical protein
MENEQSTVKTIAGELNRIRREFGFSRNDFALMFHVTPYCIDAWLKRKSKPKPSNIMPVVNFISEMRVIHKAIGLFVFPDKAVKTAIPARTQEITNRYCQNNRLEMLSYKSVGVDALNNAESIYGYFNVEYLQANIITDFLFYSKTNELSTIKKKELKDAGVQVLHSIINNKVSIEKI